jgi:hypothetical protein
MSNGNGGGGGFDFGGIFDPLLGVLAAIVQAIIDFLNALVGVLVQVLNFLLQGEQAIFGFSFASLSEVFKGLKNILDQVFKVTVVAALKHLLSLYQKLQQWIRKLKPWLDKLRKLQQQQQQAMKRFINLIQRIRQVLVIFRIFHLKFARKLDDWLAGIEGKLITRVSQLQRKTNEIIGWIDFIADPTRLLRLAPMAQSIYRYLRGLRGVLGIPESRALTVDEDKRQAQDRALLTGRTDLEDPAVQRILAGLDAAAQVYAP